MAIQSAVRCVEKSPAEAGSATAVRLDGALPKDAGSLGAAAYLSALEIELSRAPIGAVQKGMAGTRLLRRAGLALACAGLAILVGGLAGTLGSL
jgi:hypothetical protein